MQHIKYSVSRFVPLQLCIYMVCTQDCTDSVLWVVYSERLRTGFLFGKDHAKAGNPTRSVVEINNEFGNHLLVQ